MLVSLAINNYALIKELEVNFYKGYSVITGETGAGKSILLGALGLVLGQRADLSSLKDSEKKCVIEAEFQLSEYALETLFEELDLDYDAHTIIRRELLPSGKSRAFVNDTPVTIASLNKLQEALIDIHSQNKTLKLSEKNYQYNIVDALGNNKELVNSYKRGLGVYKQVQKELKDLIDNQEQAKQQYDYNTHLYSELKNAELQKEEQEALEQQLDKLNNVEAIQIALSESLNTATDESFGVQGQLNNINNALQKIASYGTSYQEVSDRINSLKIEFDDLVFELEKASEELSFEPDELQKINDRLTLIYDLQKKHLVGSISELLDIQETLRLKVASVEDASELLTAKENELKEIARKLDTLAEKITSRRKKASKELKKSLEEILAKLGMENAQFQVELTPSDSYLESGKDAIEFLLSSNKGSTFGPIKKVASGGELSRIMLGIKLILSRYVNLPTIIFDEIDTGVSGDVSTKIADLMVEMGQNMQVITISHLPQVASKGSHHYKVYKKDVGGVTNSYLKPLSDEERIKEIAEMLGGKDISESAMEHAQQLLKI